MATFKTGRGMVTLAAAGMGLALVQAFSGQAAAREQIPAEERTIPWTGRIPACDDPAVIRRIAKRFDIRESRYWNSGLEIVDIGAIRTIAVRPNGLDYIPRRFCTGRALISDGRERVIDYLIAEDTGFIGATWGVQWCVNGLDRHLAFAPSCLMARP